VVEEAAVFGENQTMNKQLVNYHLRLRVECTLFAIYKSGSEPTPYWWDEFCEWVGGFFCDFSDWFDRVEDISYRPTVFYLWFSAEHVFLNYFVILYFLAYSLSLWYNYRVPFSFHFLHISLFRFAFVGFVSFRFHFVDFVSFRFVFVHFVDFVSFRFVFVDFVSFRFVSFRFYFVSHFIGTRVCILFFTSEWFFGVPMKCETK
jgi:hypothetical protein